MLWPPGRDTSARNHKLFDTTGMKRIFTCLLLLASAAFAGTPPFSVSPLKVVLTPDAAHPYRAEAGALQDGKLVYALQGQSFDGDAGVVAPAKGATARTTPWQTLSELLPAYASVDVAAIRSLYTAGSSAFFERLEAKPELRQRWLGMMGKVTGAKLLLAYQSGDRVVAFVELQGGAGACPFAFEKVGGQYLLTTDTGGAGDVFWNTSLALANFGLKPGEIVRR